MTDDSMLFDDPTATLRRCSKCREVQPQLEFYPDKRRADGLGSWCRTCMSDRAVRYYAANKDRISRVHTRYRAANRQRMTEYARRRKYGLAPQTWDSLLAFQNNCCALCESEDSGSKWWHTDHDHRCCGGERACPLCIRGLLCHRCNLMLGNIERAIDVGLCEPSQSLTKYLGASPWSQLLQAIDSAVVLIGASTWQ